MIAEHFESALRGGLLGGAHRCGGGRVVGVGGVLEPGETRCLALETEVGCTEGWPRSERGSVRLSANALWD